jgi:uncharacterized protein YbjT (DUF2867 family)
MPSAVVFGCTGLTGKNILQALLDTTLFSPVETVSRRPPKTGDDNPKLKATVETDTAKYAARIAESKPGAVFAAIATSRSQSGLAGQWKIDHDLNVELAEAARAAGTHTYLFVSSGGTRGLLSGYAPYSRMKVGVEDKVKELDFPQAIILRPGLIMGVREVEHPGGPLMNAGVNLVGRVSQKARDTLGQDAVVIGRAAVAAARLAAEGKAPSKYWVLEGADIVRLGRDEWKP